MQVILSSQPNLPLDENSFCAAFVHQDSYLELLRQCDSNFNLHLMSREKRELQLRNPAYMLISISRTTMKQISVGTKVGMKITELVYSKPLKLIVGKVYLKKNFTCSKVPHIIIAKDPLMPNQVALGLLDGTFDHLGDTYRIPFYQPIAVSGKLGLMLGSSQENYDRTQQELPRPDDELPARKSDMTIAHVLPERRKKAGRANSDEFPAPIFEEPHPTTQTPQTQIQIDPREGELCNFFMKPAVGGGGRDRLIDELRQSTLGSAEGSNITIQKTQHKVTRPEATEVVERPPPSIMNISLTDIRATGGGEAAEGDGGGDGEGEGEKYKGCIVIKGPRGGKYILKNGKRLYVKDDENAPAASAPVFKSNMVYKVNLLKDNPNCVGNDELKD